jgi:HEAT repeat protein
MPITSLELRAALASPDMAVRMDAVEQLTQKPDVARPLVVDLLLDPDTPVLGRVWAMITICVIKDDDQGIAARALVQSMNAAEGIVRRCAIEVLGELKADWAIAQIAEHLTDHELIDKGWFDDDSTPSQAARRALESMGTPEAASLLASYAEK